MVVVVDGTKKGVGDDVRRIQQRLKALRFDPGAVDGVYGGDTIMADDDARERVARLVLGAVGIGVSGSGGAR